jgi:glutathione peroxidase
VSIYDFQVASINEKPTELSAYRGKVLLIVNTASRCSYARQFAGLQKLYENHQGLGFEILGFPCNQFNEKEPGSNSEVQEFCQVNFGITFKLFEKIEVIGESAHPLFQYLAQQAPYRGFDIQTPDGQWMQDFLQEKHPEKYIGDGIKWNFSKFLIDRDGHVKARFETTTEPLDIESAIQSML